MHFPKDKGVKRVLMFVLWALKQMWCTIPKAMQQTQFAKRVSKIPVWLKDGNPLANHPWEEDPTATVPAETDCVLIGCGLAGCAFAYHWAKNSDTGKHLVTLDMGDAASGSAGRNEGLVVMGRYYHMVVQTVLPYLQSINEHIGGHSDNDLQELAKQFAAKYAASCYRNGDMIERTIREEGFDCDYAREGWVQARDADQQESLIESVEMGVKAGFGDWTSIGPDKVREVSGMTVRHNAGFSVAAASFHPAKWCWSLLQTALDSTSVSHFSQTKVLEVSDEDSGYLVRTNRGSIRCRAVVLCTESYTPLLMPEFHDLMRPTQTQAASGPGGPSEMKPHVGISGTRAFFGRHGEETMIGSDATRVPDKQAGKIQPSRFLTHYLCTELNEVFTPAKYKITNEWSGTVTYTPDEFPVVGSIDGHNKFIIGGMAGSGTAVSFNGARCIANRILGKTDEQDDYPEAYFSPRRILDPSGHHWPEIER